MHRKYHVCDAATKRVKRPHARPLLRFASALAKAAGGDYRTALTISQALARSAGHSSLQTATRTLAPVLAALLLIQRGSPADALVTIRELESRTTHLVCVESIAATAYIQMGHYRAALAATDACARAALTHNSWLLPTALIRRAIAQLRLRDREAAIATGLDALSHFGEVHPALSLALLPARDVLSLCALLERAEPRVTPQIRRLRRVLRQVPPCRSPRVRVPQLSDREIEIALRMRGEHSYPQIAAQLYVSPSTVKTQAHTIAKKLGVRTRAQAITQLERAGFYVLHSLEERST